MEERSFGQPINKTCVRKKNYPDKQPMGYGNQVGNSFGEVDNVECKGVVEFEVEI